MERSSSYIYLDYAAMAPLCQEAIDAMSPWMVAGGNPSAVLDAGMNPNSLHSAGRNAFKSLEASRKQLACAIGARRPHTVCFTSGATEADNAAIMGLATAAREKMRLSGDKRDCVVLVSAIEHDAVLNCLSVLARNGFKTGIIPVNRNGFVEASALSHAIEEACQGGSAKVVLASVQAANSEIGTIQPVADLAACAHDAGALFHTDATQALGKMAVSVDSWGVDAASFSSHKVGGPRGQGALFVAKGVPFSPLLVGGGQEGAMRSGTQDACSAAGFAAAASSAAASLEVEAIRLAGYRDRLYAELCAMDGIKATVSVGSGSVSHLPNIVNVTFVGFEGETLVMRYDALGFAVSGGSACAAGSSEPSHVLEAIGCARDEAIGELRVSMGRFTESSHIDAFLEATRKVLCW